MTEVEVVGGALFRARYGSTVSYPIGSVAHNYKLPSQYRTQSQCRQPSQLNLHKDS